MIPHALEQAVYGAALVWLAACVIISTLLVVILAIEAIRPHRQSARRIA